MSGERRGVVDDGSPTGAPLNVRPAGREWGCSFHRCLNSARVVISGRDGAEWGACIAHTQAVKKIVKEADRG